MASRIHSALVLAVGAVAAVGRAAPGKIDFNREVRPILSENCFRCHGFNAKSRQADLRLDDADSAYADKDGVRAIVPGDAATSEAWRRVNSTDEDEQMPPPDSHRTLTNEQKATLKRWIDEGAPYAKHWSFIPPTKSPLPEVSNPSWVRNEIDPFVLARLDAEGLKPSREADRRTLIRRLSLDLTGLPPTAEEVEALVNDDSPQAYERLVDRLLASPHFGERMALDWLDAARYADTNGYSIDGGRQIWLWRDWVINAFNQNMPYDKFLVEQLAGDLLPNPTESQLIATGFQRNNMNTHEGGTIPEENLTNYNVDRVKTLGEAVIGLTLGCAQCHDHKYDPITQRDYYQVYAYFNTLSDEGLDGDRGINSRPTIMAKTVLPDDEVPALKKGIDDLRRKLADPSAAAVWQWEQDQRRELAARGHDLELHQADLLKASTPNIGAGFGIEDGRFVHITQPQELVAYDISMRLPDVEKPITGLRLVFYPDKKAPGGSRGYGGIPPSPEVGLRPSADEKKPEHPGPATFVVTAFSASAESVPGDMINLNKLLGIRQVTASSWREAYLPEGVIDTRNEDGWSPAADAKGPVSMTVTFDQPIDAAATPYLTAQVNFGHGRNLVAAKFEFLAVTGMDDGSALPEDVIAILGMPAADRSEADETKLLAYFSAHAPATRPMRIELANLEERLRVFTEKFPTLVMDIAQQPRGTFILNRGDYSQPTDKVTAATPSVLPAPPEGAPTNRLGLAQWVVMPENPLTARVAVNRIWQSLFGVGIVKTAADFGAQGEWPSHPELLDWLAVDFRDHGWDVKRLVREIVMSAAYRQDSATGEELLARDPQNRLLARGPRFRLPAEFIRDSALQVSGLLVPWIGGPSVNPYSPGNLWREVSHYGSTPATSQTFEQDHGERLYRRSLYTYWKRTAPPPNLTAFDAPNREICTVARPTTTTPLQALVLLNDVQFVEASRAFAERIADHGGDDDARLRWAFAECVSRPPSDREIAVLVRALSRERERYAKDPEAAAKYLASGESPRDERIPAPEHAAWSQVAMLLLNLGETVTCD